jgi:hypothetical protein
MLDHLTAAMPRFETYLDLYPTPQLRRAMRAIYDDFIDFCLSSADFLSRTALGTLGSTSSSSQGVRSGVAYCFLLWVIANLLRLSWSSVDKDFDKIKQRLHTHKEDFEAEAQLANVKATKKWQDGIQAKLAKTSSEYSSSRASSVSRLVSTLPFPRNLMFTGRDDTLQEISSVLQLPQADQTQAMRTVTLWGMGGVGKTQIALEYAYRFRNAYTHMFWIKSETEVELRQSMTSLVQGLGLPQGGETEQKDIDLARRWLETASRTPLALRAAHIADLTISRLSVAAGI